MTVGRPAKVVILPQAMWEVQAVGEVDE
jgi:hypothetical protein